MMNLSYGEGRQFVRHLRPILERNDVIGLLRCLSDRYPRGKLTDLLSCQDPEAVKTSLVCLAFSGTMTHTPLVAQLLQHPDPATASFAEYALWSIWFRAADERSNAALYRAVQIMSENCYDAAIEHLDRLIERQPDFAEAYNQRAIARFLSGDYELAAEDCEQTLRLNPHHFGAMAGLGHCHAAQGKIPAAEKAYRAVLRLHPHLEGIRQSLQHITEAAQRRAANDGSPSFSAL